ncbi:MULTISPECIES: hypothetical protein [unclassified Halorubrum]|uniref:hypothetical protein n=1 Tax=unclassified Halorubrum TaxID=2642239 RepID=UPI000B999A15|nr:MULTISPECIES: hypothetical protein [unclassified Halorubrum]OYR44304.1 hypothetical protein DJ74_17895 [Halorubrum sp. Ea8]OYR45048.1 hypothetical protein DJ81_05620 [Halorubrum sp. Hd13]
MSGPTRSPRSTRAAEGDETARGDGDSRTRSARDRIRVDDEVPPAFERDLRGLADVARNPSRRPLATLVAAVVVGALGYQSYVVAAAAGPVAGLLAAAAVAVAYAAAKRFWAVQHRLMIAALAAADELDRLR